MRGRRREGKTASQLLLKSGSLLWANGTLSCGPSGRPCGTRFRIVPQSPEDVTLVPLLLLDCLLPSESGCPHPRTMPASCLLAPGLRRPGGGWGGAGGGKGRKKCRSCRQSTPAIPQLGQGSYRPHCGHHSPFSGPPGLEARGLPTPCGQAVPVETCGRSWGDLVRACSAGNEPSMMPLAQGWHQENHFQDPK